MCEGDFDRTRRTRDYDTGMHVGHDAEVLRWRGRVHDSATGIGTATAWQVTASGPTSSIEKGAQDKKRGKLFTKLIREITVAARMPAAAISMRIRVCASRSTRPRARACRRTISSARSNGAREQLDGADFDEILYEGYGPGGVAVMVECLTDNRNRAVADVRHAFTKFGGNLGADGSVAYLFNESRAVQSYPAGTDEERRHGGRDRGRRRRRRHRQ